VPEDRHIAISSSNQLSPDEVSRHTFGTVRRGFDPAEVRTFLEEVARSITSLHEREQQLRNEIAEAQERAAHPVVDESTLTEALGHETAKVLRAAHEAAGELLRRAETDASERIANAERRESQAREDADRASAEQAAALQEERDKAHRHAQSEASALIDAARRESEKALEEARTECRSMVQQAQELRTRILTDLSSRRRVLHLQIEQLRAGRERLSEAIQEVRVSVDQIADELFRAEDQARLAAEAAGRNAVDAADDEVDAELAQPEIAQAEIEAPQQTAAAEPDAAASSDSDEVDQEPSPEGEPQDQPQNEPKDPGAREQKVDDLFARLRAATSTSGPETKGEEPEAGSGSGSGRGSVVAAAEATPVEPTPTAEGPRHVGTPDTEEVEGTEDADGDDRPFDLVRRDELLAPAIAGLARRVKRSLQDDQNDILHRLRSQGGWKDGVLPDASEHIERYVEASKEMLDEAARAGATFAGFSIEQTGDVSGIATELAAEVVGPLRRRLEEGGPNVDPTDDAAMVEHVGAAFREWRGDRTERLAGDHATAAFSIASLAATSGDVTVRWIVDDIGAPCPDCEDNALAEDVRPGDEFPTGHVHPPVHSGCRCLLVVSQAT
jgi:DivIVA domain-containing protein